MNRKKKIETNLRELRDLKATGNFSRHPYAESINASALRPFPDNIDSIVDIEDFEKKLLYIENFLYRHNFEFYDFIQIKEAITKLEDYSHKNILTEEIKAAFLKIKNKIIDSRKLNSVYIPGREIKVGSNKKEDERPPFSIFVNAFYIDKFPVSVRQFLNIFPEKKKSISAYKYQDEPVRGINWHEADEYCRKTGKRLPTEVEWISAAYGLECFEYATGANRTTLKKAALSQIKDWPNYRLSSPAIANTFGAYHLTGMVWEWTSDIYAMYKGNHTSNASANNTNKVLKGGCWKSNTDELRNNFRYFKDPDFAAENIGFRCAVTI